MRLPGGFFCLFSHLSCPPQKFWQYKYLRGEYLSRSRLSQANIAIGISLGIQKASPWNTGSGTRVFPESSFRNNFR